MAKPILIFDGDCGFCRRWISYWKGLTGDLLMYAPSQEVAKDFPEIPAEDFDNGVVLVDSDRAIYKGAEAVFRSLAMAPHAKLSKLLLMAYKALPGFKILAEGAYRLVANHRVLFSRLTQLLYGDYLERSSYSVSRWIYLRALGLIYFVVFASLASQFSGLVGPTGIIPLPEDVPQAVPQILLGAGMISSALLVLDVAPLLNLIILWGLYFFLSALPQDFLWFQWDSLVLEVGFLAIFLAPRTWAPKLPRFLEKETIPSGIILFLHRWILFRVLFLSGFVKLASGDPTWRNLTALLYHYESQPLPTWIGWYFHQLPEWFHKFSALVMFGIELGVIWLIFLPRRLRHLACFALLLLQVLIDATGNYGFFGWQVAALCLLLLDDRVWRNFIPRQWKLSYPERFEGKIKHAINSILLCAVLMATLLPRSWVSGWMRSFRLVSNYGVFAVMTTQRDEIILEGSDDQKTWLAYELKWKPGDLSRPPAFVEPHMPRLDWQFWFAALSTYPSTPWFAPMMFRILQGSPEVLALFEKNPFLQKPPKYLRAQRYRYRFSDWETRKKTGQWWTRELIREYAPIVTLEAEKPDN